MEYRVAVPFGLIKTGRTMNAGAMTVPYPLAVAREKAKAMHTMVIRRDGPTWRIVEDYRN